MTKTFLTCLVAAATISPFASGWAANLMAADSGGADSLSALSPIREAPRPIKPGEHGVGRMIPDLAAADLDGRPVRFRQSGDSKAVVVALTGTGCPLCLKYAPTLGEIEKRYRDRGISFVFVNPNESEKVDRMRGAIAAHGFAGPYVHDATKSIPRALGAVTTTEVFVLDAAGTVVYRGAVDDQYGFAYSLEAPRRTYLTDALDDILAGTKIGVAATSAPGCELFYPATDSPPTPTPVTYHNQVSRIIQSNCIECHRTEGIAPIELESFESARDYAGMIGRVVEQGTMPPWFAAKPETLTEDAKTVSPHGETQRWANDRSLSAADKQTLMDWIDAGAPAGDPADAPLAREFPGGWLIGQPDAVFEFPEPISIPAAGVMPYQNVMVETHLTEDRWVQAIEIRPSQIGVVHHVIVSLRPPGDAPRRDGADERLGFWGSYVPGNSVLSYPDGYAKLLPKGTRLKFQMHYTPNGTATEDSTRVGVVFAKEPPRHEIKSAGIINPRIRIPAGADNHPEVATIKLPSDIQVLGYLPHMHVRGKAARYEAITSSGTQTLLDVPRYDFNWQLLYRLAEPLSLRRGDTLKFTAWYDNSTGNPANPDATRNVRWGEQTFDEMHLGYVEYIVPGETPPDSGTQASTTTPASMATETGGDEQINAPEPSGSPASPLTFDRLDGNGDGKISRDEVRQRMPGNRRAAGPIFDRLDKDGDGQLDRDEFQRLRGR